MKISPFLLTLLFLSVLAVFFSCNSRPERKKMPDMSVYGDGIEGPASACVAEPPPFDIRDTTLEIAGRSTDCMAIAMPDPVNDSLAIAMMISNAPQMDHFLEGLHIWGKKGVLLDLRINMDHTQRMDLEIQENWGEKFRFPAILLYDAGSTTRVQAFIEAARQLPGINCFVQQSITQNSGENCFGH